MYYAEVFERLQKDGVRYLVVGGIALVLHGVVRLTGDLDLMIDLEENNLEKFLKAVGALGYRPKSPVRAEDFADKDIRKKWVKEKNMKVFSFIHGKDDYKIIDIFPENPISFAGSYSKKQIVEARGIRINVISVEDLVALKKMSAREQDLKDIEMLKELKGK